MAVCYEIVNDVLTKSLQDEASCTGYLVQTAVEVRSLSLQLTSLTFDTIGIDPAQILQVYLWGFGSVFSMWAIGYAVEAAKKLIAKL